TVKGSTRYLKRATYDLLGRPRIFKHGNGTIDVRTYEGAAENFRLASIATSRGPVPLLGYAYAGYLPTGLLTDLVDVGPKGLGGGLDNTSAFTYDGIGRLTQVTGPNLPGPSGYEYDDLGNMVRMDSSTMTYDAQRPHTLSQINGSSAGIA